jgi:uncharacterized membrane protein HdeD (DUF308 family)
MPLLIARSWWSLVLRGLLAVLVGIVTFVWPSATLAALVLLFGAYALIDGALSLMGAFRASAAHERWGALLLEGVVGLVVGVVTLAWPAITVFVLSIMIGGWAVVTGVFEIMAAIRLRRHIAGEWLLALIGIASVIFGILVLIAPLLGAIVLALWFGAYELVFGILLIALGFRLRTHHLALNNAGPLENPAR